jgi:hypothetical protein
LACGKDRYFRTPDTAPLAPIIGVHAIRKCMGISCYNTTEYIEYQESEMAQSILDIIPEYPEIKHIAANMKNAAVHEH